MTRCTIRSGVPSKFRNLNKMSTASNVDFFTRALFKCDRFTKIKLPRLQIKDGNAWCGVVWRGVAARTVRWFEWWASDVGLL